MAKSVFSAEKKMLLSVLSLARPTFLLSCISRVSFPHYLCYANYVLTSTFSLSLSPI